MPGPDTSTGRRFPALDPEPPPRPWWHRAVAVAAVVAVAAGFSLLGWTLAGGRGDRAPALPAVARSGRVLSLGPNGLLVASRPDGRAPRVLSSLGTFALRGLPSVSADGRLVAFSAGQVVSTRPGPPVLVPDRLELTSRQVLPSGSSFAAGGRDVVVMTEGRGGNQLTSAGVSVVDLRTGVSTALGTGSYAAGDPDQPGAFVSVASPPQPEVGLQNPGIPDSALDLRDAHRPSVPLASAAALGRAAGFPASAPVSLFPVPGPRGTLVAVEVDDLHGAGNAGLVVLDRTGRVVAVGPAGSGPVPEASPAWSPDGSQLAYLSQSPAGTTLVVWKVGGGAVVRRLPAGVGAGQCAWSPSGTAVLCDSPRSRQGRTVQTWILAGAGGGPAALVTGPGFAVDWYQG